MATRNQLSHHHSNRHARTLTLDAANAQAATSSLPYIEPGHGARPAPRPAPRPPSPPRPRRACRPALPRLGRARGSGGLTASPRPQCKPPRMQGSTTSRPLWRRTWRVRHIGGSTTTRPPRRCYRCVAAVPAHVAAVAPERPLCATACRARRCPHARGLVSTRDTITRRTRGSTRLPVSCGRTERSMSDLSSSHSKSMVQRRSRCDQLGTVRCLLAEQCSLRTQPVSSMAYGWRTSSDATGRQAGYSGKLCSPMTRYMEQMISGPRHH